MKNSNKNYLVYAYKLNGTIEESKPLTLKGVQKIINTVMASDIIAIEVKENTLYNGLLKVNYLDNQSIIIDYLNNQELLNMYMVYCQLFNILLQCEYDKLQRLETILFKRGGKFYAHIEDYYGNVTTIKELGYTEALNTLKAFNSYNDYRISVYWNRLIICEKIAS